MKILVGNKWKVNVGIRIYYQATVQKQFNTSRIQVTVRHLHYEMSLLGVLEEMINSNNNFNKIF